MASEWTRSDAEGEARRRRQELILCVMARRRHYEMRYCRHDQRMVPAVGPSPAWKWISPAIGAIGFFAVVAVILADPFGVLSLIVAIFYIATLGPALALAHQEPKCPLCGREVIYRTREEADAATSQEKKRSRDPHHAPPLSVQHGEP